MRIDADLFYEAVEPFANGKLSKEDHVKINKKYSCTNCFYLKLDGRNPPEGHHHLVACP